MSSAGFARVADEVQQENRGGNNAPRQDDDHDKTEQRVGPHAAHPRIVALADDGGSAGIVNAPPLIRTRVPARRDVDTISSWFVANSYNRHLGPERRMATLRHQGNNDVSGS
jgi:hypothetical protein